LILFDEPDLLIIHAMESETSGIKSSRPLGQSLWDVQHLHEDILRHIATFLDFQSMRRFRLVSREWNAACLPILMKRGQYNLTHSTYEDKRPDLLKGAIHYSSWKISRSVYQSSLQDDTIWQNVKSLTIHQKIPLFSGFHSWTWETIQNRCPNLQELTFIFQPVLNANVRSNVLADYEKAIQGLPNACFPKISSLRNLSSLHFKGIYDKTTAYFAQHLLQAATTSLRHLYFCPISPPKNVNIDIEGFRIFEYLHQNPSLLKNLQSFGFKIGHYSVDETDGVFLFPFDNYDLQSNFTELLNRNSILPLQFSGNLTTLFWDLPFVSSEGGFLPGVLSPSVASSLVQLCFNDKVDRLEQPELAVALFPIKISFPNFPKLRALKLGLYTCNTLFVPELVDCAPNLSVLELKRPGGNYKTVSHLYFRSIWRGSDKKSYSNPKHLQLRVFCTDNLLNGLTDIVDILGKFPNLVEARLGTVQRVSLDEFLSSVQSTNPKLQRLSWISMEKFSMVELFRHLDRVPEQLPDLTSYSLGINRSTNNICLSVSTRDQEELMKIFASLSSKSESSSSPAMKLLLECNSSDCLPKKEEFDLNGCRRCYVRRFMRGIKNNLPIQIHSIQEIEEMERKYEWNHRFASTWIYK
jgi:hypothetical protein